MVNPCSTISLNNRKAESASNGAPDDGFFERFGLITYPAHPTGFEFIDRLPNPIVGRAFNDMCKKLSKGDWLGAIPELNGRGDHCVRLDTEAQERFREWLKLHMLIIRAMSSSDPTIGFYNKMRGLVVRLALVLHLVKVTSGEEADASRMSLSTIEQSIFFVEKYLSKMWFRICAAFGSNEMFRKGEQVIRYIKEDGLKTITYREIARKEWKGLKSKADIQGVLDLLVEYNYLFPVVKSESGSSGGRPSYYYPVNPLVTG
jgi:hypothetical protein